MAKIKAVIFDKDGTLFPYSIYAPVVDNILRENLSLKENEEKILLSLEKIIGVDKNGITYKNGIVFNEKNKISQALRLVKVVFSFSLNPIKTAKAILKIRERYKYIDTINYDWKSLKNVLLKLSEKGIVLALFSNDRKEAIKKTEEKIDYSFSYTVSSSSHPHKPSFKTIDKFRKKYKLKNNEIAFVSDTPIDLKMAKKAKVGLIIGIIDTFSNEELKETADIVISNLEEIESLISI